MMVKTILSFLQYTVHVVRHSSLVQANPPGVGLVTRRRTVQVSQLEVVEPKVPQQPHTAKRDKDMQLGICFPSLYQVPIYTAGYVYARTTVLGALMYMYHGT